MRITILTFQFAHNYGAMLQAYALKKHLSDQGNNVDIAPYFPAWAKKDYAYSPLTHGISIRKRIRFLYQYPMRKKLVRLFDEFRKDFLRSDNHLSSQSDLDSFLSNYDCAVYGSDQIWNNEITGDTHEFFGTDTQEIRQISYAASLGTKSISDVQRNLICTYLPKFHRISVRETQTKKMIESVLERNVEVVCDPVFLLPVSEWRKIERAVSVKPNYLIVYFLQKDEKLLEYALTYAKENNLHAYVIHPTLASAPKGCTLLRYVGPQEFVWLIDHAACVCTNSFHAVSFSLLFRKKLFHIPNRKSPDRTISLLGTIGIDIKGNGEIPFYDLSSYDYVDLNNYIEHSKAFLKEALIGD